jgi:hypothetical protein
MRRFSAVFTCSLAFTATAWGACSSSTTITYVPAANDASVLPTADAGDAATDGASDGASGGDAGVDSGPRPLPTFPTQCAPGRAAGVEALQIPVLGAELLAVDAAEQAVLFRTGAGSASPSVFLATRDDVSSPFLAPVAVPTGTARTDFAALSTGGRVVVLVAADGTSLTALRRAVDGTFAADNGPLGDLHDVPIVGSYAAPALTADDLALYVVRDSEALVAERFRASDRFVGLRPLVELPLASARQLRGISMDRHSFVLATTPPTLLTIADDGRRAEDRLPAGAAAVNGDCSAVWYANAAGIARAELK